MELFKRSTSAIADFIFWPDTASCSVSAAMRASDSLSLDSATSKSLWREATSLVAVEISNFKRSQLCVISCNFVSRPSMSALISIKDDEDLEPPRARPREITSPSRVTTVTAGCERRIASAALAFSATTVEASRDEMRSPIELERICAESGVRPAGIFPFPLCPGSYTSTSACPKFSLRKVVSAVTADERSCTTTASANDPSAAAAADSQPLSISINPAMLPRIDTPRESRSRADAPSRFCEVNFMASSFDSTAFRSRSAARSASTNSLSFDFAPSSEFFAPSYCESRPSSPESALAISSSYEEYSRCA